ncbi:secreted RxLR effector protein 161-like [Apium graveolens]|uniref:secreted RxLR effector protein 161-like n=1 Tax=Apium graveolens TaxID=4045 RepID=UPI003D7B24C2
MYRANNTRPYIAFVVNLLARFSAAPMDKHWNGIKYIFRYLRGTTDFGLFFPKNSTSQLIGYADVGYLSILHFGKSQTRYVFTYCGTTISWKSTKQTTVATSTNHSELIAIHETSRECVWLRFIIKNIQESCRLPDITKSPIVMFEDNTSCIDQLKEGYVKGDMTKHISPKFFYTHEFQKNGEIDVQQIGSCDNLINLFTKSLPNSTFVTCQWSENPIRPDPIRGHFSGYGSTY